MRLQESGDMYLETIYRLSQMSESVRSVDVGNYMGVSKPSVSRAVGLLKSGGYINIDIDGLLTMTDEGLEVAIRIYERHKLLSHMLVMLGVDEETVVMDACRIEHVISNESFRAIKCHANSKCEKADRDA